MFTRIKTTCACPTSARQPAAPSVRRGPSSASGRKTQEERGAQRQARPGALSQGPGTALDPLLKERQASERLGGAAAEVGDEISAAHLLLGRIPPSPGASGGWARRLREIYWSSAASGPVAHGTGRCALHVSCLRPRASRQRAGGLTGLTLAGPLTQRRCPLRASRGLAGVGSSQGRDCGLRRATSSAAARVRTFLMDGAPTPQRQGESVGTAKCLSGLSFSSLRNADLELRGGVAPRGFG